jgi:hypothetical protein
MFVSRTDNHNSTQEARHEGGSFHDRSKCCVAGGVTVPMVNRSRDAARVVINRGTNAPPIMAAFRIPIRNFARQ